MSGQNDKQRWLIDSGVFVHGSILERESYQLNPKEPTGMDRWVPWQGTTERVVRLERGRYAAPSRLTDTTTGQDGTVAIQEEAP